MLRSQPANLGELSTPEVRVAWSPIVGDVPTHREMGSVCHISVVLGARVVLSL